MSDIQGTLKEQIVAAANIARPWDRPALSLSGRPHNAPPKKIRPRHQMAVALSMAGWTNREIARQLGYTDSRISIILGSQHPELRKTRQEMGDRVAMELGDITLRFHAEAGRSLDKLIEIRDNAQAPISEQRHSALSILDRAGYSPIKKQINFEAKVPVQELKGVIDQLDKANEVALRNSEWAVKTLHTGTGG